MIWLMGRQKSGISMLSLWRMLEIKRYKTVWTMHGPTDSPSHG
jgi:hypothetical protein